VCLARAGLAVGEHARVVAYIVCMWGLG
jgi:hypothetical protein